MFLKGLSMYHPRLGEDPQWALYRARERLDLTDPPTATTPGPRSTAARRGVAAVALALAVAATVRADTEPTKSQTDRIATTRAPDVVEMTGALVHAAPDSRHDSDTTARHSELSHSAAASRPVAAHHRGRTER